MTEMSSLCYPCALVYCQGLFIGGNERVFQAILERDKTGFYPDFPSMRDCSHCHNHRFFLLHSF